MLRDRIFSEIKLNLVWCTAEIMGYPILVIYEHLCFDVSQGRINEAPSCNQILNLYSYCLDSQLPDRVR